MDAVNVRVTDPDSCIVEVLNDSGERVLAGKWRQLRDGHWHLRLTAADATDALEVVFTEPPGPTSCFVEVETDAGRSVTVGLWRRRDDTWVLRLTASDLSDPLGRRASRWTPRDTQ